MSDAAKVICSGEGLKMGIISKEIKSVIDTRRAGPGRLNDIVYYAWGEIFNSCWQSMIHPTYTAVVDGRVATKP
jgi:hypothetical protein